MDNFIGEIRVFSFSFAPYGWAECNGQTMPVRQNPQLFALLGTRYGGDGTNFFGLPNLRDATAINQGAGQGLSRYGVGDKGGTPEVTLREAEMATHTHQPQATNEPADLPTPGPDRALARSAPGYAYQGEISKDLVRMSPQSTTPVGSGGPHNNMAPSLVLRFCIALRGAVPIPSDQEN